MKGYSIGFGTDYLKVNSVYGTITIDCQLPNDEDKAAIEQLIELGAKLQALRVRKAKRKVQRLTQLGRSNHG